MSNFRAKAKRPNSRRWENVTMLDDYYGSHRYGVLFPDDVVYKEEECTVKEQL